MNDRTMAISGAARLAAIAGVLLLAASGAFAAAPSVQQVIDDIDTNYEKCT